MIRIVTGAYEPASRTVAVIVLIGHWVARDDPQQPTAAVLVSDRQDATEVQGLMNSISPLLPVKGSTNASNSSLAAGRTQAANQPKSANSTQPAVIVHQLSNGRSVVTVIDDELDGRLGGIHAPLRHSIIFSSVLKS